MENKRHVIDYCEYASLEEMPERERTVMLEAMAATERAYAPYSHFHVGAAVMLEDGTVVLGCNQENIAYPSGLCAERTALFAAGAAHPDKAVMALAVVGRDAEGRLAEASPCGACRQVMAETELRSGQKMTVLCYLGGGQIRRIEGVENLLPFGFEAEV